MKSENKVDFFRFYRPIDPNAGFADSSKGVTFYIRLNYTKRWMRVSISVCNGDNFDKDYGKYLARLVYDEGKYIEYDLDNIISSGESILEYLRVESISWCEGNFAAAAKQLRMRSR